MEFQQVFNTELTKGGYHPVWDVIKGTETGDRPIGQIRFQVSEGQRSIGEYIFFPSGNGVGLTRFDLRNIGIFANGIQAHIEGF